MRWQTEAGPLAAHTVAHPMPSADNDILQRLKPGTRQRLLERCEPFAFGLSTRLVEQGQALRHALFPRSGFIALVIDEKDHPALAVGLIGHEGVFGGELILGTSRPPWRAVVLNPGDGWRIEAQALREVSATHIDLQQRLQGLVLVRLHQQALASACERFHPVASRLARWLLMSQDRAQSPNFYLTQECMARMLGVRRVSVTLAAGGMQNDGLISYRRGDVSVLDRARLKARACSCYANDIQLAQAYVRQPTNRNG
ncbi:Putative Crp/Fnr family transcriptional regulator [Hydrogenophaga intermedia]|uniref:Putative Crp/Fnr family transcriptional regulator n=2 Tax=Comamonadaceae TaxID=80864 RepID=A0A1L1PEA1_HYDIT|nr:Putative Crp/Fnr family transcriptional regulator [Hydrogenophaga intermedia]